jgi:hypothetical protein
MTVDTTAPGYDDTKDAHLRRLTGSKGRSGRDRPSGALLNTAPR